MKTNDDEQTLRTDQSGTTPPAAGNETSGPDQVTTVPLPNQPHVPPVHVRPATFVQADLAKPAMELGNPDLVSALAVVTQLVKTSVQSEVLAPNQLMWNEFQVLRIVAGNPKIRSSRAASRAGMSPATLSGVVDRLVERGLMSRLERHDSGRQVHLLLTEDGADLWRRIAAMVADTERRFVTRPPGRRALDALSRRIAVELDRP